MHSCRDAAAGERYEKPVAFREGFMVIKGSYSEVFIVGERGGGGVGGLLMLLIPNENTLTFTKVIIRDPPIQPLPPKRRYLVMLQSLAEANCCTRRICVSSAC